MPARDLRALCVLRGPGIPWRTVAGDPSLRLYPGSCLETKAARLPQLSRLQTWTCRDLPKTHVGRACAAGGTDTGRCLLAQAGAVGPPPSMLAVRFPLPGGHKRWAVWRGLFLLRSATTSRHDLPLLWAGEGSVPTTAYLGGVPGLPIAVSELRLLRVKVITVCLRVRPGTCR